MSSDVEVSRLGDLLEITSSKRIHMADYVSSGVPFWRGKEVIERAKGKQISTELFITKKQFSEIDMKFGSPQNGDILLTSVGTLGVPYLVDKDGQFYFKDGNVTWFRKFSEKIDSRFLYYWLVAPTTQKKLDQIAIGSTQKALTISALKGLAIPLPARDVQVEIVDVLDSLSTRISLLRETNVTLEAIVQALFKSWFVDFDPVRAKQEGREPEGMDADTAALFSDRFEESALGFVPKGWKVLPVGDAVECVGGATPDTKVEEYWQPEIHAWTTPKDLSGLQSPVLLSTERAISTRGLSRISSGLLPIGTLLMSSRAPIGYLAISQLPVAINQGYIAMLPEGQLPPLYMLFWCKQNMNVIKNRANGSTFMEISKKVFRPMPALIPPLKILRAFITVAEPVFNRVAENERQIGTLANLRDTLLPRLISGQMRLSEAEDQFDEALTGT